MALLGVAHAGFYGRNSAVLEVNAKNYDRLIAKSNHTSVSPTRPLLPKRTPSPNPSQPT